jgi:hypothetical protein
VDTQLESEVQVVGQVTSVPSQTKGAQAAGVEPLASGVQLPLSEAPSAFEQTSHPPVQAELQQKPSAQAPPRHWSFAVQVAPWAPCATHWPVELQ